jgi:Tol biopolymer transport system component
MSNKKWPSYTLTISVLTVKSITAPAAQNCAFTQVVGFDARPSFSADGTRLAFVSDSGFGSKISMFDINTNTLAEVFDTRVSPAGYSLSGDGTRIAFHSVRNSPGDNAARHVEVFLLDTRTDVLTQVTRTTGHIASVRAIIADGTRIVFDSDLEVVRHNKNGDDDIFLYGSQTHAFMPITHTGTAYSNNFLITGNGERFVFASRLDPVRLTREYADGIFLFDARAN